ncbi:NUDIX hydrolase [Actinomadura sp. DC4]|uniref:NUDIX domain-containing protein n=1 Tax=Actinomadura sp. DC4 TaxID=3055069 RepID=UPI0025B1400C|nr:NUDIX hydrolase [Actinomadura sp. DC4]MDN3358370.1 NUDIX hydrolase [Actinomadura sp. DC4]
MNDDGGKQRGSFVEPEIYYAGLAAAFVTAGALITDGGGRVLLVKPNYRDHWLFPGGTADDNESPEAACAREIKEELGLDLPLGPLLLVDWRPARAERPRPTVSFIFDAGILENPDRIRLQEDELDDHAFFEPGKAATLLGHVGDRLPAALRAREAGGLVYMSPS